MDEVSDDKPTLHVTYPHYTVWDLLGAAFISVRSRKLKRELQKQLPAGMMNDDTLNTIDEFVTIIDETTPIMERE